MKYILIAGDGMSDLPMVSLGDKTPLEYISPCGMKACAGKLLLDSGDALMRLFFEKMTRRV